MIQLDIQSRTKNPTPNPSVVMNPAPTPPKTSDSLRLRLRLRNPGCRLWAVWTQKIFDRAISGTLVTWQGWFGKSL